MVVIEIKRGSIGEYGDKASVKRALEVKKVLADIKADGVSNDLRQGHKLRTVIPARLGRRFCVVFPTDYHGRIHILLPRQYTLRGGTAHFIVYYSTDSSTTSQSMADAMLEACERDYSNPLSCFGLTPTGLPFQIYIDPGSSGGSHRFCYTTLIYLDDFEGMASEDVNIANVCEISEVFMANQGIGWDCKSSDGEGLSRVVGAESYPGYFSIFATGALWLDSKDRPDWGWRLVSIRGGTPV